MLGETYVPKYLDLGGLIVEFFINKTFIPNTLIYLGVAINVMIKDTMLKLNLGKSLRHTSNML